ncbi:MAG TPA: hypothetical protein VHV27_09735 [Phenylobacterium sp.]|nr:hypothetical protein [Phenylobacterium sp.]
MNLKMIGLAAFASLALSAGTAAAEMQPIPNPPEKPKAAKHHAKHHMKHAKAAAAPKADDAAKK